MLSRLMTLREQAILGALAAAILAGTLVLGLRGGEEAGLVAQVNPEPAQTPNTPEPAALREAPEPKLGAAAMGAVEREGLYWLAPGARVRDLIEAAGGAEADADLSGINLAAYVMDTAVLTVPRGGEAMPPNPEVYLIGAAAPVIETPSLANPAPRTREMPMASAPGLRRINLNTASQEQLEKLPGIGPVTAEKVIALRRRQPFRRIEDLLDVNGIGPQKLQELRPLVAVR